jgi:hypothetical protein
MTGSIICVKCAQETESRCKLPDGTYVRGHRPAEHHGREDRDLSDHWISRATQRAAVVLDPLSGIQQGARHYLEAIAADSRYEPLLRQDVIDALVVSR